MKDWQKVQHRLYGYEYYLYYTDDYGDRVYISAVSRRFFRVSLGIRGSYKKFTCEEV